MAIMKSIILTLLVSSIALTFGACKDSETSEDEIAGTVEGAEQSNENEKPAEAVSASTPSPPKKSSVQLTCGQRGIPSWESAIGNLVNARCEKCHSQKLAYMGILLMNYKDLVDNQEKSRRRIQSNSLTEPLDPVEQQFFMDFFKAGLPEKETDCKD